MKRSHAICNFTRVIPTVPRCCNTTAAALSRGSSKNLGMIDGDRRGWNFFDMAIFVRPRRREFPSQKREGRRIAVAANVRILTEAERIG